MAALVLAAACDAQVHADYGGEPIWDLSGFIDAVGEVHVDRMVLRWAGTDPLGPGEHESEVVVKTAFPNRFTASVLAEPPAAARLAFDGEPGFAEGFLFVLDGRGNTIGVDFERVLVWLEAGAADGTTLAGYLGGPLAAGFHVRARAPLPAPTAEGELLAERCIERALAEGWSGERATTVCRVLRAYRLGPAADTAWTVRAVSTGP
jgi:hypothetical protein